MKIKDKILLIESLLCLINYTYPFYTRKTKSKEEVQDYELSISKYKRKQFRVINFVGYLSFQCTLETSINNDDILISSSVSQQSCKDIFNSTKNFKEEIASKINERTCTSVESNNFRRLVFLHFSVYDHCLANDVFSDSRNIQLKSPVSLSCYTFRLFFFRRVRSKKFS